MTAAPPPPPPPAGAPPPPPCYRCGRPFGEHVSGLCPAPPPPARRDSAAVPGWAAFAGAVALAAGLVWAFTSSSAQACTLTGQLDGETCYPRLAQIHSVTGPAAVVVLIVAVVLFVTGRRP